jgi:ParB/RepB/Spo0J family partition protein
VEEHVTKKKAAEAAPNLAAQMIPMGDLIPTYTRDTNPNKMSDTEFTALTALIKAEGFMQSILVSPIQGKRGKFKIVDGHHRFWACQQAEKTEILAVVKPASEALAAALGLGLNRIRGELDLSLSGMVMQHVMEDTSWTVDQLALLTGFPQSEIDALTQQAHNDADEMLEEVSAAMPEEEAELEGSEKPYVLEISFADRALYQLARRKLRKAAGASKDLAKGLLAVLGEDNDGT